MEIDLTMERDKVVTVFEGKNSFPKNFAIYQLFHPFLYYKSLKEKNELDIKEINCCYLLRRIEKGNSIIKMYKYTFEKWKDLSSIKLLKSSQYNLIKK